jgi:hypothetical protein
MVKIERAEYLDGYLIMFWFDNGEKGTVSFRKYLEEHKNPLIRQYLDTAKFADFQTTPFSLHWGNSWSISSDTLYKYLLPM